MVDGRWTADMTRGFHITGVHLRPLGAMIENVAGVAVQACETECRIVRGSDGTATKVILVSTPMIAAEATRAEVDTRPALDTTQIVDDSSATSSMM